MVKFILGKLKIIFFLLLGTILIGKEVLALNDNYCEKQSLHILGKKNNDVDNVTSNIYNKGGGANFFGKACTDPWPGMPNNVRKYISYLSLAEQKKNATYIEKLLTQKGIGISGKLSKQAVAALIGNIIEECRMNPGLWERWNVTTGWYSGYGLCQWTPSSTFFKSMKLNAKKANKLVNQNPAKMAKKQLKYMWKTMTSTNPDVKEWYEKMGTEKYHSPLKLTAKQFITSTQPPAKLAKVFCSCYLRPENVKQRNKERAKRAKDWYNNKIVKENWND
ncbi:MAG: hypothetical protein IJ733_18215 [Lachnospiraceae bacterium]|nr:hypothetical protein [Lachnospiraceae bacterium]